VLPVLTCEWLLGNGCGVCFVPANGMGCNSPKTTSYVSIATAPTATATVTVTVTQTSTSTVFETKTREEACPAYETGVLNVCLSLLELSVADSSLVDVCLV